MKQLGYILVVDDAGDGGLIEHIREELTKAGITVGEHDGDRGGEYLNYSTELTNPPKSITVEIPLDWEEEDDYEED